ncbi:unnamed protein product [Hydatigera taeniaeformis]|uniref:Uncharacterized protein n=1 Tax=Hydatigena taeniaeformis TaxID=6205 RepID=A0A3P7FDK4_HYDTA|nr:unnamed protein product [Hydatigera taeniaeformis]
MHGIEEDVDPDVVWTPAYYGDVEDFDAKEEEVDANHNWLIFSTRDAHLLLKKGPHGDSYPITGRYDAHIDGRVVTGKLLSELIRSVHKEGEETEAKQRNRVSLVYYKDLQHYAGRAEMKALGREDTTTIVKKGEFGGIAVTSYPNEEALMSVC